MPNETATNYRRLTYCLSCYDETLHEYQWLERSVELTCSACGNQRSVPRLNKYVD